MFKFALAIKVIFGLFNFALPAPEIWAEPVPYFMDKQMGNYVAPLSERGLVTGVLMCWWETRVFGLPGTGS